jgi:hypothetical protein
MLKSSENIEIFLSKVKLLINYDISKTLNENYELLSEQTVYTGAQSPFHYFDDTYRSKPEITYPNYCPASKYAVDPPKNKLGATGVDALPENHCYYNTPVGGFYIPTGATDFEVLNFQSIEKTAQKYSNYYTDEKIKKKNMLSGINSKYTEEDVRRIVSNNIENSLSEFINQIVGFTVTTLDNQIRKYRLWYEYKYPSSQQWALGTFIPIGFSYYQCKQGEYPCIAPTETYYSNPVEVDRRSEFAKFYDDWAMWIQVGAALTAVIVSIVTRNPQIALNTFKAEVGADVIFGIGDAYREIERGNEITAAISFVFAFIPIIFLRQGGSTIIKQFFSRGIDLNASKRLAEKLLGSGLTTTSTFRDFYKFWKTLDKEERILIEQLFEQDDVARDTFFKKFAKISQQTIEESSGIKNRFEEFYNSLKPFFKSGRLTRDAMPILKKIWLKEIVVYGLAAGLQFISDMLGGIFDEEIVKEVEWMGEFIPKSNQEQIFLDLCLSPNPNEDLKNFTSSDSLYINSIAPLISDSKGFADRTDSSAVAVANKINWAWCDSLQNTVCQPNLPKESIPDTTKLREEGWYPSVEFKYDFDKMPLEIDTTNTRIVLTKKGEEYWFKPTSPLTKK